MKKIFDIFGLAAVVLAAALSLPAADVHAFPATQCAAGRFGSNLNCTAGDVSITGMTVVGDNTSCTGGSNIVLDLAISVNFATPDRWDVGIFIANDGKTPQLLPASGGAASCSVGILPTISPFLNLDSNGGTDTCGDGNNGIGGGTGTGILHMTNVTVPCQALGGSGGNLYIPFVVSWDNQASPSGTTCTSNADPVPNTKSKCNAPTIAQGTVNVVVLPTITNTDGITHISSGATTNYSVVITNTTGDTLNNAVFTDPAVTGITANSVSCAASGGATCPASTVAAMQGPGITIPAMPTGGSVTFTIGATLTGAPPDTRTNTASVSVGGQTKSASDTDTIAGAIAIGPSTISQSGVQSSSMVFSYTVYNFGAGSDTISLSALSNHGWTVTLSAPSVTVAPGGSAAITVTVQIPAGTAIGTLDMTTLRAVSGNNPGNTATATALTTVAAPLTLTPNNTGSGGKGSSTYYDHRVQNNTATSQTVTFATALTGTCASWTATPPATVTLAPFGGYADVAVKVNIPATAATGNICTATTTATAGTNTATATDTTTVKDIVLWSDASYTDESYLYPAGNPVYAKTYGLTNGTTYKFLWYDSNNVLKRTSPNTSGAGTIAPDTYTIPTTGPLGTWRIEVRRASDNALFTQTDFYVGPDHLNASYTGANPAVNTNATVNLSLHDRYGHVVPLNPSGSLVKGNPPTTKDPLKIMVTISGSATIVSTTLSGAVITGQTVTGNLDAATGTATITITDGVMETVTVTPHSYNSALYGSSLTPSRDEPATVTFTGGGPHHYELSLPATSVTCLPTTVTVTACADNSNPCSSIATGVTGTTSLATTGGSIVTPATFASGVATTTLSYPLAVDGTAVTVSLTGATIAAQNATTCRGGTGCTTTFNTAGFIFSGSAGGAVATIPTQVAGVSDATYYLRAVKTNAATKACESALSGAQTVNVAYECNDPATCYAANLMSVNGGTATTIARNNNGSVSSYTPVNMTFDANGNAPFTFIYSDAGQVRLYAGKAAGGSLLSALAGSSNAFVTKPYDFGVIPCVASVVGNCITAPADPGLAGGGGAFAKAGEAFKATVTARAFGGAATPSFSAGSNNAAETVSLTRTRVAPVGAGAADGTLGGTTSIARSNFSNGVATVSDLSWSEVGVITLTATNNTFLGNALTTSGTTGNVGRFYPDHFDTAVVATASLPMPCPTGLTCPALYNGFVYSGQAFTTQVTAKNLASGTTQNYDGTPGYARAVTLTAWDALGSTTTQNPPIVPLGSSLTNNSITTATFAAGIATTSTPVYTFAAVSTAPTNIYMRADESGGDGVTSLRAASIEGGVKVVSGRAKIGNAHGSELLPLSLPATVQYWNGTNWTTSTTDTTALAAGNVSFSNCQKNLGNPAPTCKTAPIVDVSSVALVNGVGSIKLKAPGTGNNGSADIILNAAGWPAWLPSTTGRATFGVYKGNNEFIYLRENY